MGRLMYHIITLTISSTLLAASVSAQPRPDDFQVRKVSRDLVTTPDYTYSGGEQLRSPRERWGRVEVQFSAAPAYTEELTFRYYILIAGKVLTGEVTHVNILGGRELYSVLYVPPHALSYLLQNRAPTTNAIENVAVQIIQKGEVRDQFMMGRARPDWFTTMPTLAGFLLNKNETPFAPLFWDRYEQIKPSGR